jgi:hypothetical protein
MARARKPVAAAKKRLYAATRRYHGLTKKRREELAPAIREELAPRIEDAAGVYAFAVVDEANTLTSLAAFESKDAAESASKRPSSSDALSPETSVDELEAAQVKAGRKPPTKRSRKATRKA